MSTWWVAAYVGEAFIGGYQEAVLVLYLAPQLGVFPTRHALSHYGVGLIAFLAKQSDYLPGEIFVNFDLHSGLFYWTRTVYVESG